MIFHCKFCLCPLKLCHLWGVPMKKPGKSSLWLLNIFFSATDSCFEILVSRIQTVRCLIVARLAPPVIVDLTGYAPIGQLQYLIQIKGQVLFDAGCQTGHKWASQEDDTIRRLFLHPVSTLEQNSVFCRFSLKVCRTVWLTALYPENPE